MAFLMTNSSSEIILSSKFAKSNPRKKNSRSKFAKLNPREIKLKEIESHEKISRHENLQIKAHENDYFNGRNYLVLCPDFHKNASKI